VRETIEKADLGGKCNIAKDVSTLVSHDVLIVDGNLLSAFQYAVSRIMVRGLDNLRKSRTVLLMEQTQLFLWMSEKYMKAELAVPSFPRALV